MVSVKVVPPGIVVDGHAAGALLHWTWKLPRSIWLPPRYAFGPGLPTNESVNVPSVQDVPAHPVPANTPAVVYDTVCASIGAAPIAIAAAPNSAALLRLCILTPPLVVSRSRWRREDQRFSR